MAYQISGTTIIDDSRNIVNAGIITATSLVVTGIASVGVAITMHGSSGIVSATTYYGDGSELTGITAGISTAVAVGIAAFFN